MWTCLGGDRATKLAQAEILPAPGGVAEPGTAYDFLQRTARRHAIAVHGGSLGERDGDTLFNTTILFGPDGAECARYRKIHLFDVVTPSGQGYRESALFGAGQQVVVARLATARGIAFNLGLTICYDLRFPELFLALRRQGAQVIFVPSAFTAETGRDHWEVLLRARAIETQCWIVAAATTGQHRDARGQTRTTWGHSMIVDPWGTPQARLDAAPGFAAAAIDAAQLERVRDAMPVLLHRRLA
jgi:nitrilase